MVSLLREAKGWKQEELAKAAHMSQGFISKVEAGLLDLRGERLVAVANAMDCPPTLLADDLPVRGLQVTCLHHRRRHTRVPASSRKKIEAVTHLSRVTAEGLLADADLDAELPLQRLDIDAVDDAAEVARQLRAQWLVASGPIEDLISLLERAGIIVHVRALGTAAQDAVSSWPRGRVPMMLLNSGLPADRQRYTVAHELGHLVMHSVPSDSQEDEANLFAGELLAPSDEIVEDLAGLTTRDFPRLVELKSKWGLSVGALIQRAKETGVITDRQFREFQIRLNRLGWKSVEPSTLEPESPALLDHIIAARLAQPGVDMAVLAERAQMTQASFERHFVHAGHANANRLQLKVSAANG